MIEEQNGTALSHQPPQVAAQASGEFPPKVSQNNVEAESSDGETEDTGSDDDEDTSPQDELADNVQGPSEATGSLENATQSTDKNSTVPATVSAKKKRRTDKGADNRTSKPGDSLSAPETSRRIQIVTNRVIYAVRLYETIILTQHSGVTRTLLGKILKLSLQRLRKL